MTEKYRISVEDALSIGVGLHKHGQLEQARNVYSDVLRAVPDQADALHLLGVALHQLGESEAAIEHIRQSLDAAPENPDAMNNLGNIYRELERTEDAARMYRDVLALVPDHADAMVNLAVILRHGKQRKEALRLLMRSIEINPDHAPAYHNLGNVYRDMRQFEDALRAFERAEELAPHDDKSALAVATALYETGKPEQAVDSLRKVLGRFPGHPVATHLLAAYTGENVPERAPDRYVRELFDDFSASFDESLAGLEYRAPQLVASRAMELLDESKGRLRMLDIGCGTGLCGVLVRPLAERLVGIDLSPKMLGKAEKKAVYDHLEEAELTAFMNTGPRSFDVVLCVDTFVYFGDLAAALDAAFKTLDDGGWLFFTVEAHDSESGKGDYFLQHHGRYSHSRRYVRNALVAAGFDVSSLDDVILRKEVREQVGGILAVARKAK